MGNRHQPGFTLVELAIVLFIVTLLLGGMLTPLSQQIASRQIQDTRSTLNDARTALVGHALAHARLPCPDQDGDGMEDRQADTACKTAVGRLPWRTLGAAETDAWGNRLDYAVSPDFAAALSLDAAAALELCATPACAQPMPIAALILSHGRNGFGAGNAMGRQNLAPAANDERANADGDARFILHPPSAADRAGGEFDDLATWLSSDWLLGRVCEPGGVCGGN